MTRSTALRVVAGIVALTVISAPVFAQRTGSRIGRTAGPRDGAGALAIIADCLLDRHAEMAARWIGTLPGTAEEMKLFSGITEDLGLCMSMNKHLVLDNKRVSFKAITLRNPVATALATRILAKLPRSFVPDAAAEPWFEVQLKAHPAGARIDRGALARDDYGHCVATRKWAGSRDLLLSSPGSPEEQAAIGQMMPVLGPCLTEGTSLQLTAANIRLMLAQPVYHLATRQAAMGSAK